MLFEQMDQSWQIALADSRPLLEKIEAKLLTSGSEFVPDFSNIMRAFKLPIQDVRVLIVGQDPYPTAGHAIGLSFAVAQGTNPLPRSLKNIMIELRDDLGRTISTGGDLTQWSAQGVMLLNRHLTTDVSEVGAHSDLGWAEFTDRVIRVLNRQLGRNLVAILWGAQAQELRQALCDCVVIASAHPSPLSARKGFFGSKPFSRTNDALQQAGLKSIDWAC